MTSEGSSVQRSSEVRRESQSERSSRLVKITQQVEQSVLFENYVSITKGQRNTTHTCGILYYNTSCKICM